MLQCDFCLLLKVNTLNGCGQAGWPLSLSKGKPLRSHGRLKISGLSDWVDVVGCTKNQVVGR